MSVKRWKFIPASEGRPAHMKKDQTGAYVEKHSYEALRASHEELMKALQLAQWAAFNDSDWGNTVFCTECRRDSEIGHHSECSIAIALANAQKVREG